MGRRTLLVIASVLVAAAGTALIWMYVQGADRRAQERWAAVPLLVATGPIETGSTFDDIKNFVAVEQVPQKLVPAKAIGSLKAIGTKRTTIPIMAGQVLVEGQFDSGNIVTGVSDKNVAVAVAIDDPNRVAGLLRPESHVAVYKVGPGNGGSVTLLFSDIRVIGVGSTTNAVNAKGKPTTLGTQTGVSVSVVTLDLQVKQAPTIVSHRDSLYFAVLGKGAQVTQENDIQGSASGRPAAIG